MIEIKYAELLATLSTEGLEAAERALSRERVIRETMRETGEPREISAEMVDALDCMTEEAVLDLMDGEPTSLRAGLVKYIEGLAPRYPGGMHVDSVTGELEALLEYPWPVASAPLAGLELSSGYPEDDEHLVVKLGGREVATANHDEHGWSGMEAVQRTAEQVHAAMISALTS